MHRIQCVALVSFFTLAIGAAVGDDWRQFRGPGGQGISSEKGLPTEWSADKNIVWKLKLPGAGSSSPITLGNRVFITCYSGYGLDEKKPGDQKDLKRHVLCVDRTKGQVLWEKQFDPVLPEHKYQGEGAYQGYAPSTPTTDGERLHVFFGKSGVYCFDLDGKELWHESVGKGTNGWGSGPSPVLYKNTVIINASVESGTMVALDKRTGKEVWKAKGIGGSWNTPLLQSLPSKETELVLSMSNRLRSYDPDTGKELWDADGIHRYVVPSVVAHAGVVYLTGGGSGHYTLAVKAGGRGDVTKDNTLWKIKNGSNVGSPIYYEGHLYWASEGGGEVHCQDAATGKFVYSKALKPSPGRLYASPVLADGKIYYVSQEKGTYVIAASPKFAQLAHNAFKDDKSRTNASIAVSDGQLFLRSDENLYCIGKK